MGVPVGVRVAVGRGSVGLGDGESVEVIGIEVGECVEVMGREVGEGTEVGGMEVGKEIDCGVAGIQEERRMHRITNSKNDGDFI